LHNDGANVDDLENCVEDWRGFAEWETAEWSAWRWISGDFVDDKESEEEPSERELRYEEADDVVYELHV
jgi:hypothetical protein